MHVAPVQHQSYRGSWITFVGLFDLLAVLSGVPDSQKFQPGFNLQFAMAEHVFFFGFDIAIRLVGFNRPDNRRIGYFLAFGLYCKPSDLSRAREACGKIWMGSSPAVQRPPRNPTISAYLAQVLTIRDFLADSICQH